MTHNANAALPTLSIVIPSYNQRDYLEEAIRSVLDQDVPVELLVLDGGSTDGSDEVIKRYSSRIAYWRSAPDEGQAAAIREGFERATGDVLGWLNSDDRLHPGAARAMLEALRDHPEAEWAVGHADTIDERSRPLLRRPTVPVTPADLYNLHLYLPQESTFFRRSAYEAVGGVDASLHYAMDYDLWLKLARLGPPVFVDAPVGTFRVVGGQKSSDVAAYQAEEALVKQRHRHYFAHYGRVRRYRRMVRIRGARLLLRLRGDGPVAVGRQLLRVWRGEQVSPGSTRGTIVALAAVAGALLVAATGAGVGLRRLTRGGSPSPGDISR